MIEVGQWFGKNHRGVSVVTFPVIYNIYCLESGALRMNLIFILKLVTRIYFQKTRIKILRVLEAFNLDVSSVTWHLVTGTCISGRH